MSDYVQVPMRQLNDVINAISTVNHKVDTVGAYVVQLDNQMEQMKKDLAQMIIEQRMQAALQRALTEIIRVRQEVESKFGNYKVVRDTMMGILQAADLSLITESTLSRCTEELMISTPEYWLAPCLIALAGWISNNESLARRAVCEAVKRDEEKTSLLFALICRRNGRTKTCFEWLNKYFAIQDPLKMNRSVIAFVDAYANGVFGEDADGVCMGHITHWMEVLKQDPEFDEKQVNYWKGFFSSFVPSLEVREPEYKDLAVLCKKEDFALIEGVISRLLASDMDGGAKDSIRARYNAEVDQEKLIKAIDNQLKDLVTNYDKCEESLREEEERLQLIKELKGDEEQADYVFERRRQYQKYMATPVDFAERLQQAVGDTDAGSVQKTALVLLKDYILEAYSAYVSECKDTYPGQIGLQINEQVNYDVKKAPSHFRWEGKTTDGGNYADLKKTIEQVYEEEKAIAMNNIKVNWFAVFPGVLFLGIPTIITFRNRKKRRQQASDTFDKIKAARLRMLNNALSARARANEMVADFYGQEDWDKLDLTEEEIDE